MFGKIRFSRWLLATALLMAVDGAGVAGLMLATTAPASAQWFFGGNDDNYRRQRPQQRPSGGGFFQNLFGPFDQRSSYPSGRDRDRGYYEQQPHISHPQQQQPSEVSSGRAPAPKKADKDAPPPTTSIVVMGDAMADWLAYGLEDAFADAPEIGVVRKNKLNSGLLRYDPKGDLDWWHVAKDLLATEKPNYVVMMLGLSDRQNIRERDLAKEAEKKAKEADKKDGEKKDADKTDKKDGDKKEAEQKPAEAAPAEQQDAKKDTADEGDDIVAPEPRGKLANGVIEFRSERWEQVYSRRIDDTIAALKSKGVPVFWVGMPAIRGTKSTADMVYLNDLYRGRAEKAGAIYIDVWDGFVDENGKFTTFGPDFEGQNRRLRTADGVFFTKYGARKLAHYVEREIRRYMANRGPIALPSGPIAPAPSDGRPAERPLAGPVVPLTTTPANADALLGGGGAGGSAYGDALASRVLVKGETVYAPYGRGDDFVWPRSETNRPAPPPVAEAAPAAANASASLAPAAPPVIATPEPVGAAPADQPASKAETKTETRHAPRSEPAERTAQTAKPRRIEPRAELRPSSNAPRPPAPVGRQQSRGPFDWFR